MANLAIKNLFHEKVRLVVTLTGIVFSVILTAVQLGIFLGFIEASTGLIANTRADLWITSKNVSHVETGVPFSERKFYQVLSLPNVAKAEKHIVTLDATVKKSDGSNEGITLVGFDLHGELGSVYNVTQGSIADLEQPDAVFVDELYAVEKLGVTRLNQIIEINKRRARVVGFTRGIRIFTSQPAIFTSFKNAQTFLRFNQDQTLYVLVKAEQGANVDELKQTIQSKLTDVDVNTKAELVYKQAMYWVIGTGAGITVLIAAALAIIVGVVIVAQTIYSATVDHIREYGTLKAMGATNFYLYRIIITQSIVSGLIAFVIGIAVSIVISQISLLGTLAIIVNWQLCLALFALTMLMCAGASVVAIRKATTIDPAMVFKG